MNQYRCETCNYYEDDDDKAACNIREEWISTDVWNWIKVVGCASHSSHQSERDKVLDEIETVIDKTTSYVSRYELERKIAELRQKASEQCGDNCKGECSGEVTGTPFCPQNEQYCLWIEDEDGVYQTSCLHSFQFINGTPETNGIQYCPYCGNLIRQAGEP